VTVKSYRISHKGKTGHVFAKLFGGRATPLPERREMRKDCRGLAKIFFYAGARSLLISHWPVESKAATQLTTTLFKNLKDNPNLSRAEAFRRSMMPPPFGLRF